MPLLHVRSSSPPLSDAGQSLLRELSAELARELGKPESYVMVSLENNSTMLFGGTSEPACFAVLKNIGTFAPAQTERLSALLTARLAKALGVAPSRIYLEFVNAQGHLWGHDGSTFA